MTEAVAAEAVTPEGGDGGSSVHLASGDLAARWRAVLDEQPLAVGDNYARDNSLQEAGCKSQYSIFSRIPEAERRVLAILVKVSKVRYKAIWRFGAI